MLIYILLSVIFMVVTILAVSVFKFESIVKRSKRRKVEKMVSVILPTYNLNRNIESTLRSISEANGKKEIIIAADGKITKKGIEIAKKYADKIIVEKRRLGKAEACNRAIKFASSNYVLFVDDDTIISKNLIKVLLSRFDKDVGIVIPKYLTKNKHRIITELTQMEELLLQSSHKVSMVLEGTCLGFRGCCFMVRKDIYEKIGGMRNTLTEDLEFAAVLNKNGYKIIFEPEACALTEEYETLSKWFRHKKRCGKGAFFSFLRNMDIYLKSPSFFTILVVPILISMLIWSTVSLNFINTLMYISLLYSFISLKDMFIILLISFFYILHTLTPLLATITGMNLVQYSVLLSSERRNIKIMMLFPFLFIYMPLVMIAYSLGIFSAIKTKIKGRKELVFKEW